jgi:hypothetical protein
MTRLRAVGGGIAGGVLALAVAPLFRGFFHPPTGGIGWVTVNAYPKPHDYFTIALVAALAFAGALAATFRAGAPASAAAPYRRYAWPGAIGVFVLMLFVHDHPDAFMDRFHEGEHLTAGFLMREGARPFGDVFLLHGLATEGGLDVLVQGDPPSPRRIRRAELVASAAALALLVPLAAELCATGWGVALAVLLSLSAVAAGQLPTFPWFRLATPLLVTIALVRYARDGRPRQLAFAFAVASLGLLWSIDTGTYSILGCIGVMVLMRFFRLEAKPLPLARVVLLAAIALALPFIVLAAIGADVRQFLVDSYVIIPTGIDPTSALPVPNPKTMEGVRFWLPPVIYAVVMALAWRLRREPLTAARMVVIGTFGMLLFRSAAGRCSWSHTRFAIPFLGIALAAFLLEPLWLERRRAAAVLLALPLLFVVDVVPNVTAGAKFLAGWRARQRHTDLVAYPFATGKGIYTYAQDRDELAALNGFIDAQAGPVGTIYDFAGERALYYLLQRKPPVRCLDTNWMSVPRLWAETKAQLAAHPPELVIVKGPHGFDHFDGVTHAQRAPELASWIDANYPRRVEIGRYVVAVRAR